MAANNKVATDGDSVVEPSEGGKSDGESDSSRSTSEESTDREPTALPLDQVFEILKNERRRTVLRYLENNDEPVALGDLAEFVAANENDMSVKQISSRERKCAYVGLYQCHLPKMDNMDIIDFNQSRGLIETGPNADQLKEYMDWPETPARQWPVYHLGLSASGLVALTAAVAVGATGSVALAVALGCLLGTAATAVAQLRSDE